MFRGIYNFFRYFTAPKEVRSTLANPANWLMELFGASNTVVGNRVNTASALSISTVYACVKVLAESIASLPIHLHQEKEGSFQISLRPENYIVGQEPSERYTSYAFRSAMMLHACLSGNAYAEIIRDGRGGLRELRILNPSCVVPFYEKGKLYYRVNADAVYGMGDESRVLMPYEILHISTMTRNGVIGISPIQELRETMGMDVVNRENAAKTLSRGRVDGLLKSPNKLTVEDGKSLREQFGERIRSGDFPVLQNGVEYQAIQLTPADAQFIQTAQLTRQQIAAAYRVPLHMIGDLSNASFSNIEHQSLEFVKYTLLPWIKAWEMELNRKLLPVSIRMSHYFRFNVEGLLRGDLKARMEAHTKAVQWGIMNRDEVRAIENLNPIPDGMGQIFLTPLNMIPIDQQDQQADQTTDNIVQPAKNK